MGTFFIEFRDPLFSVIIFFALVFVITFSSYWWGRYKSKEDSKNLDKFLRQFRTLPSKNELQVLISSGELSEKSWLLLAHSYTQNGNYEKAIEIYNELLKSTLLHNKKETLFLLGKTYFKAGFLERARQIFLEILKKSPRTPQALEYLLLVYEQMRDYKAALEVLEPLDTLGVDTKQEEAYLHSLMLLSNANLTNDEKALKLLDIYNKTYQLTYMTFEFLFKVDPKLAWQHFDSSKSDLLADILWGLEAKNLDLDIISKNSFLRELYSARGDVTLAQTSSNFELDILINLQQTKLNATLHFEYSCECCKHVAPFAFHRCSFCHAIGTSKVEWSIVKDYHKDFSEENNSFQ